MKSFNLLASFIILLNIRLEAVRLRTRSRTQQEFPKNIKLKEDKTSLTYIIKTPQFPSHVTEDDITYFMYPDKLVLWAKGSEDILHKEYINEDENKIEDMRGVNTGRDWELWLNFAKALKANGTSKPMIVFGKKRLVGNSYEITVTLPKAALEDHFIKLHRIYDYNDTARMTKVDYRMKLPANPHYVKRVVNYPDGHSAEIFTVTAEDSRYYKELNQSLFSNDTFNIMNDTQSLMSLITGDDMKRSLIKIDDLKTDKSRNFHREEEPQQTSD